MEINSPALNQKQSRTQTNRFWELDFLRGFCIILMVIDHFFYTVMDLLPKVWSWCGKEFWTGFNEFAKNYWDNYAHSIAHYVVVTVFMLVCGISCTLSRSNLVRGLRAAGVAVGITVVTKLTDSLFETGVIWFGVIHMYACAILLYWVLSLPALFFEKKRAKKEQNQAKKVAEQGQNSAKTEQDEIAHKTRSESLEKGIDWGLKLLPAAVGLTFIIVFFAAWGRFELLFGYNYNRFYELRPLVDFEGGERAQKFFSVLMNIKSGGIESADYFPLIPYAAIVLFGSLIGHLVYNTKGKNALKPLDGKWNKPVSFVGRHALFVYLLHQVVFIAFIYSVGSVYFLF